MEYTWGSNFTSAHLGTSIILSSVLSGLAESIIVLRLDSRDIQPVAEFNTLPKFSGSGNPELLDLASINETYH